MSAKFLGFLAKRFREYCRVNRIFAEMEPALCSFAEKAQTFGS